ncbi:MAG TPA: hypothetical protein DEG32_01685, partial [Balneolaceae bacterium]|nr:hypothetical protein [Balneolaceae bacterium]
MKKTFAIALSILFLGSTFIFAQDDSDITWEEYIQQRQQQLAQTQAEQDSALYASIAEYEAYVFQQELEFSQFREEMERQWGDFKERTKSNWVEYKNGGNVR